MRQRDYAKGTISHLIYPEHRIIAEVKGDILTAKLPAMLALELYHSGVIPQDEEKAFRVDLDGKYIGIFRVIDLRYPLHSDLESIIITLKHVKENGHGAD
ncbi:MAG: hypothetical protein V3R82_01165 [Candidatus Hydrothermarchaeales archaeon]